MPADRGRRRVSGSSRSPRPLMRERLWFLSMLFVRPGLQGAGLGRALLARVAPGGRRGLVPRHGHRQRPADQQRAVRLGRDRAAHPAAQPHRAAAGPGRVRRAAVGHRPHGLRGRSSDEPGGEGHQRLARAPSTRSIARCSASPIRRTTGSCARRAAPAGCTAAPTGPRWATATRPKPAGSARSPFAIRSCSPRSWGTSSSAVTPRGAFALWLPGHGRSRGRAGAPGRLPAGPVPGPAVLGPALRRPDPLPAHLARSALTRGAVPGGTIVLFARSWARW